MIRLLVLFLALTWCFGLEAQKRVFLRKGTCPNATQIANRTSTSALVGYSAPPVPATRGAWYCDPVFGSLVVRLDGDEYTNDSTAPLASLAFNKDSTYAAWGAGGGGFYVAPVTLTPTAVYANTAVGAGSIIDPLVDRTTGVTVGVTLENIWFDMGGDVGAPCRLFIADRDTLKIYQMSVCEGRATTGPNAGKFVADVVADLTATIGTAYPKWHRVMPTASGRRVQFSLYRSSALDYGNCNCGYGVIDITNVTGANPLTAFTVKRLIRNDIETATTLTFEYWTGDGGRTWQNGIGNGASGSAPIGYKQTGITDSGWLLHSLGTSPEGAPAPPTPIGPWNSPLAENLDTGELKFIHGSGHGDLIEDRWTAFNTSGFGACLTGPKTWLFSSLTSNNPSLALNGGSCLLTTGEWGWVAYPGAFWTGGVQYASTFSKSNVATIIHSCPPGGCPSAGPPGSATGVLWAGVDEIVNVNTATGAFKRMARLFTSIGGGGYTPVQPIQSRRLNLAGNPELIMFASNFFGADGQSHIYVVVDIP
jgi:hypothetical protein